MSPLDLLGIQNLVSRYKFFRFFSSCINLADKEVFNIGNTSVDMKPASPTATIVMLLDNFISMAMFMVMMAMKVAIVRRSKMFRCRWPSLPFTNSPTKPPNMAKVM